MIASDMNDQVIHQLEALAAALGAWCGADVLIAESISRSRDLGHDRHFATRSVLAMRLMHVGTTISGTALTLDGDAGGRSVWYQVALDAVTAVAVESHAIVLVEQFEERTERRTEVTLAVGPTREHGHADV
jgi:hypothetical protein